MTMNKMLLSQAFDDFILATKADGSAPATVRWYESILGMFVATGDIDLQSITTKQMRAYIVGLQSQTDRYVDAPQKPTQAGSFSNATIEAHKRALHRFLKWCSEEYNMPNPMKGIKRKKYRTAPKSITSSDFVKLINATLDNDAGLRDRAILAFLADTGCRLGGLLTLEESNLFRNEGRAIVYEKGQWRAIHFTPITSAVLAQWLDIRQSDSDFVFVSMNNGKALTESGVNQVLKRLKKRAGVRGRVNPHAFRHNFAREYLKSGGDLATLSKLLGHADISTTVNYYAIFTEDELGLFHAKHSPINNLPAPD